MQADVSFSALTTSTSSAAGLLEHVRQRLQSSLALPIRVQAARQFGGQLWHIGSAVRLLATRATKPAASPPPGCSRLLVYDYVSRQLATRLRAQGAYYADAAGNAWLQHPELLVNLQGCARSQPAAPIPLGPIRQVHLLRLLFQLLLNPALAMLPVPSLAAHTQFPLAVVQHVLRYLAQQGYWQADAPLGSSPLQLPSAAQYWFTHYPSVLRQRLNAQRYRPRQPQALAEWLQRMPPTHCLLSGEAAARQLLGYPAPPKHLVLYGVLPRPQLLQQLDLVPSHRGSIELLTAFFPPGVTASAHPLCVPPLLAYADLLATPTGELLGRELRAQYLPSL